MKSLQVSEVSGHQLIRCRPRSRRTRAMRYLGRGGAGRRADLGAVLSSWLPAHVRPFYDSWLEGCVPLLEGGVKVSGVGCCVKPQAEAVNVVSDLRASACKVVSDGSCRPRPTLLTGNWRAAAAAAACCWKLATWCRLCSSAAECSCALRRSSATLEVRCSALEPASLLPANRLLPASGFTGQHEHSPAKPAT